LIEKHVYEHPPQFEYWWDSRKNKNINQSLGVSWTKWHDLVQVSKHLNNAKQIVKLQIKTLNINSTNCKVVCSKGFTSLIKSNESKATNGLSDSIFYMLRKLVHRFITLNHMACRHHWELNGFNITNVQNSNLRFFQKHIRVVATPLWPSVGVKPNTSKVGDLESSGTPECLELDSKAQNTSHWAVLGVIEKVLKRRYRKWPRIGHLDFCRSSYGQKKGRESNCQSNKVGNRPLPDLRIESATWRWKYLDEGYNFGLDLVTIGLYSRELWAFKVPRLQPGQFRDNFGTPTWESREKEPFGCSPRGRTQSIL
jgi:hypothetical protein